MCLKCEWCRLKAFGTLRLRESVLGRGLVFAYSVLGIYIKFVWCSVPSMRSTFTVLMASVFLKGF